MISKWFHLKEKAIVLRQNGCSIRHIEKQLKIPRSTLSGWFKMIVLTHQQKDKLRKEWLNALGKARQKAVIWHHDQKNKRLEQAKTQASEILSKIDMLNPQIVELALAMLYLGEGFKKSVTALGNSDPLILKFFLFILLNIYHLDPKKIRCELHLRADQNPQKMKRFWSQELNLSIENFKSISIDQRTKGSKTYSIYKGVCIIRCGNVAIQRKLLFLANMFCNNVIHTWARSSAG